MANLYTKAGDKGTTGLVGGSRVSKSSLRVTCYGTIDEANSMLGLAYAQVDCDYIRATVHTIQERLFALGAEFASDEKGAKRLTDTISPADIAFLEGVADHCTSIVGKQSAFVVPGVDPASASLHVARTIVRRAERYAVELNQTDSIRPELLQYINRLSDALFALARLREDWITKQRTAQEQTSTPSAQDILREKITAIVKEKLEAQTEKQFNLASIQKMAARAAEKSKELGVPVVFSAVDNGGNLILLHRMEGALLGSVDVSIGKAYTANAFKLPTHVLADLAKPDGSLYGIQQVTPGKTVIFGGGFPFILHGEVVGGIGVSGGSVEEDMEIAQYAMT